MTIAHNAELNRRVTVGRITPLLAGRVVVARPKTLEKTAKHLSAGLAICHQESRLRNRQSNLAAAQV